MSNNPMSEKLTFNELINKHKIEIPIIQRDYAQGRAGKEELRANFLSALLKAVDDEKLELDFVYGSVKKDGTGITTLQPLDGQQRLTTLFLLHWFIAVKENKLDENLKNLLTKFTYETRTSSREFCFELIDKGINYQNLLETDYYDKEKRRPKNNKLSKTIIDSSWFFLSWKRDPTIKSMLTMVDAIHHTFHKKSEVWNKLNNISFHFVELQNFGLSDDLYIKMNARGKALTDFENFKAKFEQHINIKQNNWEQTVEFTETFTHKIDTVWTDLFWQYRDEQNNKEDQKRSLSAGMDDQLLKFFASIAILLYAQNQEIYNNEDEEKYIKNELENKNKGRIATADAVKRERVERRIAELFNDYKALKPIDFPTINAFEYLKKCFDLYSNVNRSYDKLSPNLNLWDYVNGSKVLFQDNINSVELTTYKKRVLFYAQTCYLNSFGDSFNIEEFSIWLRVVRNIVENSTIDSTTTFIGAVNLINELSIGSNSIYEFLSNSEIQSRFADEQVKEEVRKAKLIKENNELKNIIYEIEDTDFCKGTINWCLECTEDDKIPEQLLVIREIIKLHFDEDQISNLLRRAFFTIGDNRFYEYQKGWSYGTDSKRRCLIESRNDLKNNFTKGEWFDNYFKPLVIQLYANDLQSIIDNYAIPHDMPNWKMRLIKEPTLLDDHCQRHYIGITNDNTQCYLYGRKKRPSSREECKLVE